MLHIKLMTQIVKPRTNYFSSRDAFFIMQNHEQIISLDAMCFSVCKTINKLYLISPCVLNHKKLYLISSWVSQCAKPRQIVSLDVMCFSVCKTTTNYISWRHVFLSARNQDKLYLITSCFSHREPDQTTRW